MGKQDTLTFKETMVEGDYLRTLSKEEKREYKKKSVEEKRKIIHEFNPQKFEPSDNEGNKILNWLKKHKIWSGIIILLLIGGFGSIFTDSENTESEEPKKETTSKENAKNTSNTNDNKKEQESKVKSQDKKDNDITNIKQDGYDVYERDAGMPLSENSSVKHFSMEMSNKLKEDHQNIEQGAIFKDIMKFEDEKGNETKMVAAIVYVSNESINEINYKNWPKNPESLYDVADGIVFHAYINNNDVAKTRNQDEIPQQFYDMLGEEK